MRKKQNLHVEGVWRAGALCCKQAQLASEPVIILSRKAYPSKVADSWDAT